MAFPIPRARAIVAGCGSARWHAIAATERLLDIEALGRHLGKDLIVIESEPLERVCAIPGRLPYPVVIDRHLLSHDRVMLPDEAGRFHEISALEFERLTGDASLVNFSSALPTAPRDPSGDRAAIRETLTTFTSLRIHERLHDTLTMPPLPEAARRILELKADPDFAVHDLVRIVEADPSLAARMLGWANSAFYGRREPVQSIDDAITRVLGANAVLNMALAIALQQELELPAAHVRGLSPFWLEAMYCAATTEALANQLPRRPTPVAQPGLAYLTGLLANFGTLILGHVFPPFYARICVQQDANRHLPHTYIDRHTLGIAREIFAAGLLESWDLPAPIVDAVRSQYDDCGDAANPPYGALLRLAHRLLASRGLCDEPKEPLPEALAADLALSPHSIEEVLALIDRSAEALDGMAVALSA